MKTLTTFLILFTFLAFGQKVERLDRNAATQAWEAVTNLPPDTPSISGGGLVIESEPNGLNRRVLLIYSYPGTYLLRGRYCDGNDRGIGGLNVELNPYGGPSSAMIYKSVVGDSDTPFDSPYCAVEAIKIDKGRVEQLVVDINPWQPPTGTLKFQVGGETTINGLYQLSVPRLPEDAIVILGRGAIGKVQTTPFGSTIVFPSGVYLPPPGPTTLTVCSKGRCNTTTFERRLVVESAPSSGGKG